MSVTDGLENSICQPSVATRSLPHLLNIPDVSGRDAFLGRGLGFYMEWHTSLCSLGPGQQQKKGEACLVRATEAVKYHLDRLF